MLDANETYQAMFRAMTQANFLEARKLALSLREYFDNGGQYPYQYTKVAMDAYISSVLWRTFGHIPENDKTASTTTTH